MLRSLVIRNYRGIAEGKVEDLGRVNLLVGPNGSGKSTVLEGVFLGASQQVPNHFNFGETPIIQMRHNESSFPSRDCWFGKDNQRTWEVHWLFPEAEVGWALPGPGWTGEPQKTLGYMSAMRFLDIRMLLDNELEWRWSDELLRLRGDRILRKVMNEVYGLSIENFTYSASTRVLQLLFSDRNYPLKVDDLGAGMRIALRLFMSVLLCKNSAVLAEEFDGYQHIESFPRFVRTLCELSRQNNTQLFLATHSMETIRAFVEEATERPDTDLRVYQTMLKPDGTFQAAGLTAEDAATLVAGGFDVRRSR
jgi:ABC-type lipoprotein export system ATPase subunit